MATCTQTISTTQPEELLNEVVVRKTIDSNVNALYLISSNQDQSIFVNLNVVGNYQFVAINLTIYKKDTMQIFGNMTINSHSANSSFTIQSGEYYICIRSQLLSYDIAFSARFIRYSTIATLLPSSTYGWESTTEITLPRIDYVCNQPLIYEIIDGALPIGLTMLPNGYIYGDLPMLDVDEFNADLPPSNTWYEKIHDNEYVTTWGRAYRFKVRVYLKYEPSKFDEEWMYISIVNDFNKNLRFVESYEMLPNEKVVTFEEQIKISSLALCKPCPSDVVVKEEEYIEGGDKLRYMVDDKIVEPEIDDDSKYVVNENNMKYLSVESKITDFEEPIINEVYNDYNYNSLLEVEMVYIDTVIIPVYNNVPRFKTEFSDNDLVGYYLENYESGMDIIEQLKDSCMFQIYLIENNFDKEYINYDASERFDYKNIIIDVVEFEKSYYIEMKNNFGEESSIEEDAQDISLRNYIENYSKLPLTTYAIQGWYSVGDILV